MREPVVAVLGEHLRESLRNPEPGLTQLHRIERNRRLDRVYLEPEPVRDRPGDALDLVIRGLLVLEPPTPVLEPAGSRRHRSTIALCAGPRHLTTSPLQARRRPPGFGLEGAYQCTPRIK